MQTDLDEAWTLYQDVVAPAPVERGFVLASCLALWVVAYVADWAAFRLWVPFEATLPAGTLFLFTSLLGTDRGPRLGGRRSTPARSSCSCCCTAWPARTAAATGSPTGGRPATARSCIAGSGLGVVAVVCGTVFGPSLPGADSDGVLDPRASARTTRRASRSARSSTSARGWCTRPPSRCSRCSRRVRAYWRLTSLEEFDGRIWSSSGSFGEADGELPESVPTDVDQRGVRADDHHPALAAIWLPSAYEPRALDIDGTDVRYDEESATLIVDNDVTTATASCTR